MRIINKKYLLIIILIGVILTGVIMFKPNKEVKLDDVILKQEVNNKTFAMYIKNDDKYEEYNEAKFPEGYDLNLETSKCIDNSGQEIENALYVQQGKIGVKSNKSFYCYLYFDLLEEKEFEYTGNYQVFIAPKTGNYQIELWGASGDNDTDSVQDNTSGRGAYTKGIIELKKQDKLYIYIGQVGVNQKISYNGGGPGESSGGGATDIRLNISETGNWDNFESLKSRIMVAGGGGGGVYIENIDYNNQYQRGDGGKLNGIDAQFFALYYILNTYDYTYDLYDYTYDFSGHGGTQTGGGKPGIMFHGGIDVKEIPEMTGKFGSGGYGISKKNSYTSSGGGGGYYGGGHGNHTNISWSGGGGGSSFISGYKGCIAIDGNSTEEDIKPKEGCDSETNNIECSYHYTGKFFTNAEMIAGNAEMPTHDGEGTMVGNIGNGYARIKLIDVG